MSNENGSSNGQKLCEGRFSCIRCRSYLMAIAVLAEDGKLPFSPSPEQCLGLLAEGQICTRYLDPSSDEDGRPLTKKPRYFLDD